MPPLAVPGSNQSMASSSPSATPCCARALWAAASPSQAQWKGSLRQLECSLCQRRFTFSWNPDLPADWKNQYMYVASGDQDWNLSFWTRLDGYELDMLIFSNGYIDILDFHQMDLWIIMICPFLFSNGPGFGDDQFTAAHLWRLPGDPGVLQEPGRVSIGIILGEYLTFHGPNIGLLGIRIWKVVYRRRTEPRLVVQGSECVSCLSWLQQMHFSCGRIGKQLAWVFGKRKKWFSLTGTSSCLCLHRISLVAAVLLTAMWCPYPSTQYINRSLGISFWILWTTRSAANIALIRTQIPMVFRSGSRSREPATHVRDEGIHHLRKLRRKRTLEILQTLGPWSNTTLSYTSQVTKWCRAKPCETKIKWTSVSSTVWKVDLLSIILHV